MASKAAKQPQTIVACLEALVECLMPLLSYLGLAMRDFGEVRPVKSTADVVLVAIDMENPQSLRQHPDTVNSQVGLAVFDTRSISKLGSESEPISTHYFITGCPAYIHNSSQNVLFGKAVSTSPELRLRNIKSVIPQDRKIVLIGHNITSELLALVRLGFDLETVEEIVDTYHTVEDSKGLRQRLGFLLRHLDLPCSYLHNAGNDAHYTLLAAILLATREHANKSCSPLPALKQW